MASFEARIEAMTQITIESSGTAPDHGEVTDFLLEGIKDLTNKIINLRPDEAFKFADESTASDDNGITVSGKILSVVREHDSTSILRPCTPMSAELRYEATDVNSLHYKSKYNPGFYILNKKVYVRPAAAGSDNDMKVSMIDYPTTTFNASAITDFPDEYEHMIVIYGAAQSCLAAASDIHNNMPTKPSAPTMPNFTQVDSEIDLPEFPVYNPPNFSVNLSQPRNYILKEDFETSGKILDVINKEFDAYDKINEQHKEIYNKEVKIFDEKIKNISGNKDREFQFLAGDYRSQIYKYQYDITQYQSELQEKISLYKWYMEKYISLTNEYNKGIAMSITPKEAPKREASSQVKPPKEIKEERG
tara:strand:- start:11334 stop:12416 length:1083 start_codon:yes stop_codon:yes gene_type:complete